MAKVDMHVICYKILKYIYACNKGDQVFDEARIRPGSDLIPDIPESYWMQILKELTSNGFITGVDAAFYYDNEQHVIIHDPRITMAGEQYLAENTMMRKAGEHFKNIVGALSFLKP